MCCWQLMVEGGRQAVRARLLLQPCSHCIVGEVKGGG